MKITCALALLLSGSFAFAQGPSPTPVPLAPPAQDQGLPYTRTAAPMALAKIKEGIAVYPGSRYGYVQGYRVRLSETNLLRGEAVEKDGVVYVPAAFAALAGAGPIQFPPVPPDLSAIANRWVYSPSEAEGHAGVKKVDSTMFPGAASMVVKGETYLSITDVAKAAGLPVTRLPNGVIYLGPNAPTEQNTSPALMESIVTLFRYSG